MAKRRQPNSRLRAERLNRGWTQNGLVERIHQAAASRGLPEPRGLDANYVSRWERGMAPELYHGYLLCLTFQLPPAALELPEECLPTAARLEMEIDTKHTVTESENRMKRRELMKA